MWLSLTWFYFSKIICFNTFLEFLSFVHVTSKLSILSNHAEHPKRLAPYYTPSPFYNSKISIPNGSASLFGRKWLQFEEEVISHKKNWVSEAPTGLSCHRSNDKAYVDSIGSNKLSAGAPKTSTAIPSQTLPFSSEDLSSNQYSQQYLDQII